MLTISFTELRTKSKKIAKALESGEKVELIHRSRNIGTIIPKADKPKIFSAKKFQKVVDRLNFPVLTTKEIDKSYRKAMEKKHGKGIL